MNKYWFVKQRLNVSINLHDLWGSFQKLIQKNKYLKEKLSDINRKYSKLTQMVKIYRNNIQSHTQNNRPV